VDAARVAIQLRSRVERHAFWQHVAARSEANVELRKTVALLSLAVAESAIGANVILAMPARSARAAPEQVLGFDADPLTGGDILDAFAQRHDVRGELVTALMRFADTVNRRSSVRVQVAAANAGGTHPKQNLARTRFGVWQLLDSYIVSAVEDCCFHVASGTL
jgi:hypothetical protein